MLSIFNIDEVKNGEVIISYIGSLFLFISGGFLFLAWNCFYHIPEINIWFEDWAEDDVNAIEFKNEK